MTRRQMGRSLDELARLVDTTGMEGDILSTLYRLGHVISVKYGLAASKISWQI